MNKSESSTLELTLELIERWSVPQEFNVLALVKGKERYIFVFDDDSRQQLIDTFRDQAADPHLSLSWFDALVLTRKAREQEAEAASAPAVEMPAAPRPRI